MESTAIVGQLAALAQEGRLAAFRRLLRAGPEGLAAGDLARALAVPANTLSAQLAILAHAGLVSSRRQGRSIRYHARPDAIDALIRTLIDECCGDRPGLCFPPVGALPVPTAREAA